MGNLQQNFLSLLAALLGGFLMGSSTFEGELRIANPPAEDPARRGFENATRDRPWQDSLGLKFVPAPGPRCFLAFGILAWRISVLLSRAPVTTPPKECCLLGRMVVSIEGRLEGSGVQTNPH